MARRSTLVGAEYVRKLTDYEEHVRARLKNVIARKADDLHASAHAKAAGGVLNVRKGKLARSIEKQVYENENGFGARVYSKWYIARFYERGFGGKEVSIKAHTRHVTARDVKARIETNGKMRKAKVASGIAFVKEHSRTLPKIERPFLKPSLEEMRSDIRAALAAVVKGS